jgi:hypothetical protein
MTDPNKSNDSDTEIDVISLNEWGFEYGYVPQPSITIPSHPYGLDDTTYLAQLAIASYDFMMYFQREHFQRMKRISDNMVLGRFLPRTMPIPNWLIPHCRANFKSSGYIDYQHPDNYHNPQIQRDCLLDPFFAHPNSPGRTNNEDAICPPSRQEYDIQWINNIEDRTTTEYILAYTIARTQTQNGTEVHVPAALPRSMRYDNGAPIDVNGFPMTHHYDMETDRYIPHGPNPAFLRIHEDPPTEPVSIVLQRWQTGPNLEITRTNPLYQFARHNIEIPADALLTKPEILYFNPDFFTEYSAIPNFFATLFKNQPHRKTKCFNVTSPYYLDPPNINGQFAALHHNCYPATRVDDVYKVSPSASSNVHERFHAEPNLVWNNLEDLAIMRSIDESFIQCNNDEERVILWKSLIPHLLMYDLVFCSVCGCRLPEFYFSSTQHDVPDTQRACRHCDMNRSIKLSAVSWTLGTPRRCTICSTNLSEHYFSTDNWKTSGLGRICLSCSNNPDYAEITAILCDDD